jgi:hypothetical protein
MYGTTNIKSIRPVAAVRPATLSIKNFASLWISEQTVIISLFTINQLYLVYDFSVITTNTINNCFSLWLLQHVSIHMSHHQANLEPLNIFEFLFTVVFVSKAAD